MTERIKPKVKKYDLTLLKELRKYHKGQCRTPDVEAAMFHRDAACHTEKPRGDDMREPIKQAIVKELMRELTNHGFYTTHVQMLQETSEHLIKKAVSQAFTAGVNSVLRAMHDVLENSHD